MTPPTSMDWSHIQGSFGPATEVPQLIQAVARGDAASALTDLRAHLIDGGSSTPAAVPAAALLGELLREERLPALPDVLVLLADLLVCGRHEAWVIVGYDLRGPFFDEAEPDQPGRAVYETIAAHVTDVLALLDHEQVEVRAATGPLLAYLSRQVELVAPALWRHLPREQSPVAQASLALAGAHQARYEGTPDGPAVLRALRAEDPVARAGVAAALVVLDPVAAQGEVDDALEMAIRTLREPERAFGWFGGSIADLACVVAQHRAVGVSDLELALRFADAAVGLDASIYATGAILETAFAGDGQPTPRARGELSARQSDAVIRVARSEDAERISPTVHRFGLPASPAGMLRVAGEGNAGPLDRVVGGEPLVRLAALALRSQAAERRWHEAIAGLTVDERISTARDALVSPMWLRDQPRPEALDEDDTPFDEDDDRAKGARAVELLVPDLASCEPVRLAIALRRADEDASGEHAWRAALALGLAVASKRAGGDVPPEVDVVLGAVHLPDDVPAEMFRSALDALPLERRAAVVLALSWAIEDDERVPGGVRLAGAWLVADAAPTPAVAGKLLGELDAWCEHEDMPADDLVALLRKLGAVARPAMEAALEGDSRSSALLRRALA